MSCHQLGTILFAVALHALTMNYGLYIVQHCAVSVKPEDAPKRKQLYRQKHVQHMAKTKMKAIDKKKAMAKTKDVLENARSLLRKQKVLLLHN